MFIENKTEVSESYPDYLAISTSFPVPLLDPQEGKPDVGSELSEQWENLLDIIVLQFVGHPPGSMGFDFITLLPSHCSFVFVQLLLVFGCGVSFLVGSRVLL